MCIYVYAQSLSHVWLFVTAWTVAHQALLSMGFLRQKYWNGLSFPPQGIFLNQGSKLSLLYFRQILSYMYLSVCEYAFKFFFWI